METSANIAAATDNNDCRDFLRWKAKSAAKGRNASAAVLPRTDDFTVLIVNAYETVPVDLVAPPKVQVSPVGRPEHARATLELKPLRAVKRISVLAVFPLFVESAEGFAAIVNSGCSTVTVIAVDTEGPKPVAPVYDAVMLLLPRGRFVVV